MKNLSDELKKEIQKRNNTLEATKMHSTNALHQFCRDVDYYRERGMEEKEAIRYVKYWYGGNKNDK